MKILSVNSRNITPSIRDQWYWHFFDIQFVFCEHESKEYTYMYLHHKVWALGHQWNKYAKCWNSRGIFYVKNDFFDNIGIGSENESDCTIATAVETYDLWIYTVLTHIFYY